MTFNPRNREMASRRLYEEETSIELVAARHGLDAGSVLDFSLNINPFGPPESAVAAAQHALAASHLYPDLKFSGLRVALAATHDVPAECLFFGAGLDDVLKLIVHAWTGEDDGVLIHVPTFPRYELEARLRGCRIVRVENEAPETINPEGIARALGEQAIALAFLCTPNNPTGARLTRDEIASLAERFRETLFVVDEALICPLEEGSVPLVGEHANLVVLRTFSKYYGLAGLRVGYAVADSQLVSLADAGRPPFNMSRPSVEAATAVLADREFLEGCAGIFAEERAWFIDAIGERDDISVRGGNANMLLLDLGAASSAAVAERLAALGVVVADATSFAGLEQWNMLRVSLRSRADNEVLVRALGEVL